MKRNAFTALVWLLSAALLLVGCDTLAPKDPKTGNETTETTKTTVAADAEGTTASTKKTTTRASYTGALVETSITFDGTDITVKGDGAEVKGTTVVLTAGGTYSLSGNLKGRVIIDAKDVDLVLRMNGVSITCGDSCPLYIHKAAQVTVELSGENALTDGAAYVTDGYSEMQDDGSVEPDACLFSRADLILTGDGSLNVTGNARGGIVGKDTLRIEDATLAVKAAKTGINGKDELTVKNAAVTVDCGGDALRSTGGNVSLEYDTITLTAGEDGIQSAVNCTVNGSTVTVVSAGDAVQAGGDLALDNSNMTLTAGGGHGAKTVSDTSRKGLKCANLLTISGGIFTVDAADDALHANGNVTVSGGTLGLSSGDDGIHADEQVTLTGGHIHIVTSYEGIEGKVVDIGGTADILLYATDDGINAADGSSSSGIGGKDGPGDWGGGGWGFGPGGRGGKGGPGGKDGNGSSDCHIYISGGTIDVTVPSGDTDGLDSNGDIVVSGGVLISRSGGSGNMCGSIDCESELSVTGGTVIAVGGIAEVPEGQDVLCAGSSSFSLAAGTYTVTDPSGKNLFTFVISTTYRGMYMACDAFEKDVTYTLNGNGAVVTTFSF